MPPEQIIINGSTETFGIVGNPVRHSLSPVMHNAAFAALGMNCVYVPLLTSDLRKGVDGLKALGFRGVSVTIPHKEEIVRYVEVLDPVAARIGAVNTLVIGKREHAADRTVYGYNTDWLGANRALGEQIELAGSRVLLVGAGGSARAIGYGLLEAGAEIVLANRTVSKGQELADRLGCDFCPLDRIEAISADVLVNTTSVGMTPGDDGTPVAQNLLPRFSVVMDIVYAPLATRLLQEAASSGCKVVDGLSMLLYQGVAQFELWTGREAPVKVMRKVLQERIR
jgi:shikimate dehydrogenase